MKLKRAIKMVGSDDFPGPLLLLETDEGDATITTEQPILEHGYPAVYLGFEWEARLEKFWLMDGEIRRGYPAGDLFMEGFTRDPDIVAHVRVFLVEANSTADFEVGELIV